MLSRSTYRARLAMTAAIVVAVGTSAAVMAAAAPAAATQRSGAATFSDPTGDIGVPPDLGSVAITDDATTGTVTFTVTAAGYPTPITDGSLRAVLVNLDTDKNAGTGSGAGSEYSLTAMRDGTDSGWFISRWDGTQWADVPQSPTMRFTQSGDTLSWTFNKTDIGGATGFAFSVAGVALDANKALLGRDLTPDGGSWAYDLSAPAPAPAPKPTPTPTPKPTPKPVVAFKPVIGPATATPARPVAGARFTVVHAVTRSDSGAILRTGTMTGEPSIGGKALAHTEQYKGGTVRVSLLVPKGSKGKSLKLKVAVNVGTQSSTRVTTFRIG